MWICLASILGVLQNRTLVPSWYRQNCFLLNTAKTKVTAGHHLKLVACKVGGCKVLRKWALYVCAACVTDSCHGLHWHSLKTVIHHRTSSYRPSPFQHTSNVIPHDVKKSQETLNKKDKAVIVYVNVMQLQGLYSPLNSSTFNFYNFALNPIYSHCIEYAHL